jgi:hypothetical protein
MPPGIAAAIGEDTVGLEKICDWLIDKPLALLACGIFVSIGERPVAYAGGATSLCICFDSGPKATVAGFVLEESAGDRGAVC